jgi:hypothetical protein
VDGQGIGHKKEDLNMERIREHGTVETASESGEERIRAIRRVVDEKQYGKIDGEMADLFTCVHIIAVYDALSEQNKEKYQDLAYARMAHIAFKLSK